MPEGASRFPIVQLLSRIIDESGFSVHEFIQHLGYRDVERGLRRLDLWLQDGTGHQRIIKQIAAGYPSRATELNLAISATAEMRAAEVKAAWIELLKAEAATFCPYVHVEGETTVPSGLCIFAVSGGKWNLIELPQSILGLPIDEQLACVAAFNAGVSAEVQRGVPFLREGDGLPVCAVP